MHKEYCTYYQARVEKNKTWFMVGSFRNDDHIAFERAFEGQTDLFEFFVPVDQEKYFLHLIQCLQKRGVVLEFEKKPNRLAALSL
jgi:hypothetical protein